MRFAQLLGAWISLKDPLSGRIESPLHFLDEGFFGLLSDPGQARIRSQTVWCGVVFFFYVRVSIHLLPLLRAGDGLFAARPGIFFCSGVDFSFLLSREGGGRGAFLIATAAELFSALSCADGKVRSGLLLFSGVDFDF